MLSEFPLDTNEVNMLFFAESSFCIYYFIETPLDVFHVHVLSIFDLSKLVPETF